MRALLSDPQIWKLASIPLMAALVGWLASATTTAMTFGPIVFRGWRPFGWHGTVPRRARRIAECLVDRVLLRVVDPRELLAAIDAARVAAHIADVVDRRVDVWTDEIMYFRHPALWRRLPDLFKRNVTARVREEMPRLVRETVGDVAARIEDLVDLRSALVERLAGDPDLLVRLMRGPAAADLRFARRLGALFGYLLGLALLLVVIAWPVIAWLPVGLALIGALCGPLAMALLYHPARAWRLGPLTIQGHFLRRRPAVARAWAELLAGEILTVQQLAYAMLHGPRAERARELIRHRIQFLVDELAETYGPLAGFVVGAETLAAIRISVGDKAVAIATDPFDHWPFLRERAAAVEPLLRERLELLAPPQLEQLLRPCFELDGGRRLIAGAFVGLLGGAALLVVFWL